MEDMEETGHTNPAFYPNHVWSIDGTIVLRWGLWPTYVLVVLDHFSRKVVAAIPLEGPNAGWVCDALEQAFRAPCSTLGRSRQNLHISDAMPTVMVIIDGWRFHFFANEGPRPHIHVVKGDGAAKIWLDDQSLADWNNLTKSDRRRILKMVEEHQVQLLEAWHEFFKSE